MRSFKWFYAAASIGLRPLIKLLDLLLFANGRNGSLTGTSYFGWVLFNIAILVILVVFASERAAIIGAGSLFVLHFVIIFSALLIIREETRVWDGLMEPNERLLPEVSCVRNVAVLVISSSALLFISACLLYQIDKFTSWHLLLRRPDISLRRPQLQLRVVSFGLYRPTALFRVAQPADFRVVWIRVSGGIFALCRASASAFLVGDLDVDTGRLSARSAAKQRRKRVYAGPHTGWRKGRS